MSHAALRPRPASAARAVRALQLFAIAAALAACSKSDAEGDAAAGAAGGDAAPAADTRPAGDVNSTIRLVVTGGKHAGTYDAKATDGGCSYGYAEKGAWGNQYSIDPPDANTFSSLQLIVPNAAAAKGGTKEFLMTVMFGPLMGANTQYEIDTRARSDRNKGSGTLTVDDRGGEGRVTFAGQTADGVKLEGTIDCHKVMRAE